MKPFTMTLRDCRTDADTPVSVEAESQVSSR